MRGTRRRIVGRHVLAAIAVSLLPVVVAATTSVFLFRASPGWTIPYVNDEVAYWNQIAAFEAAGFHGGYVTINEHPSAVAFSRFGPHGPAFPALYGLIAKVTGWHYASGPLFGAVAVVAAVFAWVLLARPRLPTAAALFASFWPLILALPNTMQEPLHFALACVFALLIGKLLFTGPSPALLVSTMATVAAASFIRPVWGLLLIPLGWHVLRHKGRLWSTVGAAAGLAACALLFVAFTTLAAPYRPDDVVTDFKKDPLSTVVRVARRAAIENPSGFVAFDAEPLEIAFRYELLAIAALGAIAASRASGATAGAASFVAMTAGVTIVAVLALGNLGSWQDYRATTPILLMLLLIAAWIRPRLAWFAIAAHLFAAAKALETFESFHAERFQQDRRPAIERFAADVRPHIAFDPSLSGWGNTVLLGVEQYQSPLLGLPRGIGASTVFDWGDVARPMRSRYLLLTPAEAEALRSQIPIRKLTDTSLGELYENLDWRH